MGQDEQAEADRTEEVRRSPTTAAHRLELGPVSKDLVAVARQALAVDRALVEIANERAQAAREDVS